MTSGKRAIPPGTRYGALTLVRATADRRGPTKRVVYEWLCDCGGSHFATAPNIRLAKRPSCGCLTHSLISEARTSHGMSLKTSPGYPTFMAWQSMRWRCLNKSRRDYKDYGGRGIKICERWGSFESFLADMGLRPAGLTLERNDVNGNYEPGNCRWATPKEQSNNKRNNAVLEFGGRRLNVSQWSEALGIPKDTLRERLIRGWTAEAALTTPVMNRGPGSRRAKMAEASV